MTQAGEITGLGFDTTNNRLCICSCNDIVQSWSILKDPTTGIWTAQNIFSRKYTNLSPQAIMFAAIENTTDRDIIVFGLHNNGPIYTLASKTGQLCRSGRREPELEMLPSTGGKGFSVLTTPPLVPHCSVSQTKPRCACLRYLGEREYETRPRHVRFAESGLAVISGSDHGVVYVFETRTGELLQKLEVGVSQWVQAIATAEIDGVPVIFAALT
ncbi:hypothetical protein C8R44DRAFT_896225 [Mycena epipterygia]|nr:hypothetical protein C8R44DRAFT_896225 [Mycena epipterygia]